MLTTAIMCIVCETINLFHCIECVRTVRFSCTWPCSYEHSHKMGILCIKVTSRRVRITSVIVEKAKSITYSECVPVALVTQHAKCMGRIILLSAACPALLYFCTLSHKWQDFGGKFLNRKYVWIKVDQLDDTCFIIAQHVSDVNTSIFRS